MNTKLFFGLLRARQISSMYGKKITLGFVSINPMTSPPMHDLVFPWSQKIIFDIGKQILGKVT